MGTVRVAVVGVGNCAASLVQGVHYYRDTPADARVPGLMHVQFGDYHVSDVEFVAAFDVDAKKVGQDLSEAIVASENNTIKICDVPPTGITVQRGVTLDGLGKYYRETITESDAEPVDVVAALKEAKADVVVCYLPVGSEDAARFYAQAAIDAGCAFVTVAVTSWRIGRDQREQAAAGVTWHNIRIDVVGELMLEGTGDPDPVERFVIHTLSLPADMVGHACSGQEIAFVGRIDKESACETTAAFTGH